MSASVAPSASMSAQSEEERPRRQWGSGSLFKRGDGRWVGSVEARDGRPGRHRRYVTGRTEREVKSKLRALSKSTTSPGSDEALASWLRRWLAEVSGPNLRARTRQSYAAIIEGHIIPAVGGIALGDLAPADVQALLRKVGATRSPQTVHHVRKVLSSALEQAFRWGMVGRNVARLVPAPRITRKELRPWTAAEARKFLAATKGDEQWALWVLAITTGMRQGELLGLRWADLDRTRGIITVAVTIRQVDADTWVSEEPKTRSSRRTIPLTDLALEAIAAHTVHSAKWVFARPNGRPLPRAEVTRRFQATAVAKGLPSIRFHDLRHTAASLMLEQTGGDLHAVKEMLGHATIATTADIYGHLAERTKRRLAEGMDAMLRTEGTG